jgi:hypothetical protein
MDFNTTIDLIIKDLDEARKIIDDLKNYPGVPSLQIELAKSKCKSAGEVIGLLKNLRDTPVYKEKPEKIIREPETEKTAVEVSHPTPDARSLPPVSKEKVPYQPSKKSSESIIIADKFSHLSNRLNEQMGSLKTDDDISGRMKTKPLISLSEAIGVNDKFLFMREIFDGNKDAYNQAMIELDKVKTLSDAREMIMSYPGSGKADEAVKQLLDLVKRKLPSNE